MASDINEISDVEELIRQAGMDNSDTGEKIVDYFKNKRAALQTRGRLYDGSDNSINFRLDNLQPVQLPQTNSNLPTESSPVHSSNATEAACVALVRPLSELSVVVNRVPSFMSPGVATGTSPVHTPEKLRTNVITSPTGRSTVHVSPMVANPNLLSARTNLQKELLLQQYKRKNQMKCEAIRNASQLASSTPIAGESSERRGNNLLDIRETISPINDDQEHSTPHRVLRSPNVVRERIVTGPSATYARSINTPVPATQDVADGVEQDFRESTPPRDENHRLVVIPETPSPVRRSSRVPSTPLSGLSLQYRQHVQAASLVNSPPVQGRPIEHNVRSSPSRSLHRSILKNSERSFSSVRNRVSFSDKLVAIRTLPPVASSDESQITSDESEELESDKDEPRKKKLSLSRMQRSDSILKLQRSRFMLDKAKDQLTSVSARSPDNAAELIENSKAGSAKKDNSIELTPHRKVEASVRNHERNVQHSRRLFRNSRSNAIESLEEPTSASPPDAMKRCNNRNRTNSNVVNMIMEDWNEPTSEPMEVDNPNDHRSSQLTNQTVNKSLAITNIDTPRTVMMDIFDPPSAFCDDTEQGDRDASRNAEQVSSDAPGLVRSNPSLKRTQDSVSPRGLVDQNENNDALNPRNSMLPACVPRRSLAPVERIVSMDSPNDHVPLNMIEVVDMIHSRVNSEMMAGESENDRRTTINMPPKRRQNKLKVDNDTVMYFKSVEAACSQDGEKKKNLRNRRKLFAQELSDGKDCDEPRPLPLTQDDADTPEQEKDDGYVIKPLSVLVRRLSATTLSWAAKSIQAQQSAEKVIGIEEESDKPVRSPVKGRHTEQHEKPVESPVKEKQNEEQNEKGVRPKVAHGKTSVARQKSNQQDRKNKKKRTHQRNDMDETNLMIEKCLKNMSNEIRHQIESEGPRRSHRNRRLAAEVLRNNPNISCHAAPQYVMPTIDDVLKYCKLSNTTVTARKAKKKSKSSNANKMKSQIVVPPTASSEERKELENKIKRVRGRPKKCETQKEKFDGDGFRIPPVPTDELPGPSSKAVYKTTDHSTETNCSSTSDHPQGVSIDSGLASAAMMSDDATVSLQPERPTSSKVSSRSKKKAVEHPEPPCSSVSPPANEIMAEKRKTLDWMMMLMENRQNRTAALPMVEIQGFTHLSLEHLAFEERDGIEYSFYVYSNGDNFGFLRIPPETEKKTTRTKRCSLKFLILNGSVKFIINESVVNAVGGDFLMIPTSTSYRIVNGPGTTLMFMIKSSASTNTN